MKLSATCHGYLHNFFQGWDKVLNCWHITDEGAENKIKTSTSFSILMSIIYTIFKAIFSVLDENKEMLKNSQPCIVLSIRFSKICLNFTGAKYPLLPSKGSWLFWVCSAFVLCCGFLVGQLFINVLGISLVCVHAKELMDHLTF